MLREISRLIKKTLPYLIALALIILMLATTDGLLRTLGVLFIGSFVMLKFVHFIFYDQDQTNRSLYDSSSNSHTQMDEATRIELMPIPDPPPAQYHEEASVTQYPDDHNQDQTQDNIGSRSRSEDDPSSPTIVRDSNDYILPTGPESSSSLVSLQSPSPRSVSILSLSSDGGLNEHSK